MTINNYLKMGLLCMLLSVTYMACEAKGKKHFWRDYASLESLLGQKGDSIVGILTDAKTVKVSQWVNNEGKWIYEDEIKLIKPSRDILSFLLLQENMHNVAAKNILAKFCPMVKVDYIKNAKERISIYFDFGLSRWCINDNQNNELCMGIISDSRVLNFFHELYPENETINYIFYNNKETK